MQRAMEGRRMSRPSEDRPVDQDRRREHFRLRGEVASRPWAIVLQSGSNLLGSSQSCDGVLAVRGISRRHSVVHVDSGCLRLEDLDSRNGTYLNAARIASARVVPGDRIRLGPVELEVDWAPAGDESLGIELVDTARQAAGSGRKSTTYPLPPRSEPGLALVEAVVEALFARPGENLAGAVEVLRRATGAVSVSLRVEHSDGVATALGQSGERLPADTALPCVDVASTSGGDRLRLTLWRKGADVYEPALRLLLRLFERYRPRALQDGADTPSAGREDRLRFPPSFVRGVAPAMSAVFAQIEAVADSDLPILVLGETGCGKEHIVETVHASSSRRKGPLIALNCAAIPTELLEAELFGISAGVATGVAARRGKFELADGGTLFLDEVAEMPPTLQAKLLRAVQARQVQPLGSDPRPIDVRLVAATNTSLRRLIETGRFRADLYYRLAGCVLRIPPLRQRREDIPLLVESFLRRFQRSASKSIAGVTVRTLELLTDYPWPGNVRELQHELQRLVHLSATGQAIDSSMVSDHIQAGPGRSSRPPGEVAESTPTEQPDPGDPCQHAAEWVRRLAGLEIATIEREVLLEALRRAGGNKASAARLMGLTRSALGRRLAKHGLRSPVSGVRESR